MIQNPKIFCFLLESTSFSTISNSIFKAVISDKGTFSVFMVTISQQFYVKRNCFLGLSMKKIKMLVLFLIWKFCLLCVYSGKRKTIDLVNHHLLF